MSALGGAGGVDYQYQALARTQLELQRQNALAMQSAGGYVTSLEGVIKEVVGKLLPGPCRKHVFRYDCGTVRNSTTNLHTVHAKWTFYNDVDARLKLRFEADLSQVVVPFQIERTLEVVDTDYEEWMATAIMSCDAGDDVWQRESVAQLTASEIQMRMQQSNLQAQQSAMQIQQNLHSEAMRGLLDNTLQMTPSKIRKI